MMEFKLRAGTAHDVPALSEIERDAAQLFAIIPGYEFCATGAIRDAQEFQRGYDDGTVIVAEAQNGKLAGFALIWVVDGDAHLTELDVARKYQGRGLGRSLVSACEYWCKDEGYRALTLTTFSEIAWNMPFYTRLGFCVFEPDASRTEMAAIIEDERLHGFRAKPRVEMRKKFD